MPEHIQPGEYLYVARSKGPYVVRPLSTAIRFILARVLDVVDETDEKGLTGLMWAAGYGQLNSVRQLLKCGADVNYRGPNSETTLHLAAAYGHHDVVKILLNHGADPNACDEVRIFVFFFFEEKKNLILEKNSAQ